ncbi:MAG: twin-arginine translocase TatA/TatE family subunit [Leptospiraceae bacterium]|nr:twin-arginine translocase TatA/TatE family subunit [Leptospiraceae bacterium]
MIPPLAFINLGPWEIALIVILALLLFGGKKLPTLAKDLGTGIKEFRKSLSAAQEDEPQPAQQIEEEPPVKKAPQRKKSSKKKA